MSDWDFSGQDLSAANFIDATLDGTNLTGAIVTDAAFGRVTSKGFTEAQLYATASYANKTMRGIRLSQNDLSGWNFRGLDVTGARFDDADLSHADLSSADLTRVSMEESILIRANLANANLTDGEFDEANLTAANLSGANLTSSSFRGSNLSHANLTDADLTGVAIAGANLSGARGFTEAQLYSTSSYQANRLNGIGLAGERLTGWNFRDQGLFNAQLNGTDLSRGSHERQPAIRNVGQHEF